MTWLALTLLAVTCVTTVLQVRWAWRFLRLFDSNPETRSRHQPAALIVISLRGADPYLRECLLAVFRQDYPSFDVHVIVDSRTDAAWGVVEEAIQESGATNVQLSELETPIGTCGLRVNALLQAVGTLRPEHQVVAWVDADVIPYPGWLHDMVQPFHDQTVGATSGLRWYVPAYSNPGTLVRTAWNTGGVIQMVSMQMAFGGSLAYRADLLRQPQVQEQWSRLLWEDLHTQRTVSALGYRLAFVGNATLPTRERISLPGCLRFMSRQMLNVRLYHSAWWLVALLSLWMVVSPLAFLALLIHGFTNSNLALAGVASTGLVLHLAGLMYGCLRCGYRVRRHLTSRGETPWQAPWAMTPAVLLTPIVYLISIVRAALSRCVVWRDIQYQVNGPYEVRLVEYRPYVAQRTATGSAESL
ncbi:MAG: glycosyltransferase family 2 protein [Planctomycetaceae bacterium]|nr:glycosyltransferase family 2 protein [Planctomycetaceae bacterium]